MGTLSYLYADLLTPDKKQIASTSFNTSADCLQSLNDYKKLSEFGNRILEKAASGALSTPVVPGNRPYKKSGTGMLPKADATCTSCGLCARKCPSGAISADELKLSDKSKCISCMRCVSICPVHARKVSQLMTSIAAAALKKACSIEKENELFI